MTIAAGGGATVDGSGSDSVTITGTLAQINTLLAVAGGVVYRGAQDFFGDDTLTLTTDDGGNTGSGGVLIDSDQVTIHVNTWLEIRLNMVSRGTRSIWVQHCKKAGHS